MGLFNRKISTKSTPLDTPDKFGDSFFYPINGINSISWGSNQYLRDYLEVPEVNGVINQKVSMFCNGIIRVISDITGKEIPNNDPFVKLLREPNYFQSQKEWMQQTGLFGEIYGNEYIFFLTPVGMPNSPKAMFNLPPDIVVVNEPSTPFFLETTNKATYWYTWNGQKTQLSPDSIIHINRANVSSALNHFQSDLSVTNYQNSYTLGTPAMAAQQMPIRNIRAAYEARNVMIENRGALGILSNFSKDGTGAMLPIDPKAKKELQDDYKKFGMTKSQYQIIITSLPLQWQQMSIDTDKLKLFEEIAADFQSICTGFGMAYEMFTANQTYDNKLRAERQTYQNTIIPMANEKIGALNHKFKTQEKSWHIEIDYSYLPIFQENIREKSVSTKQMADAFAIMYRDQAITLEQYQAELLKLGIGGKS
jgi:hypothetical protein